MRTAFTEALKPMAASIHVARSSFDQVPRGMASSVSMKAELSPRLDGLDKPTVWHEFTPLAVEHGAVNLGQGFPDWDPPQFVVDAMARATDPKYGRRANQYARSAAHMPLAEILAKDYSARFGFEIDPATEVATAVGCTNALYCALQGLLAPGDEVILLEPAFDIYTAQVKMAGGVPKYVPIRSTSGDGSEHTASSFFHVDFAELEDAIAPKTKVMVLNTPHNPTGKMFCMEELESIAEIIKRNPHVVIISDEVYEHIIFDSEKMPHISVASLPGMFQHTLTLSSSGKTFSATGWKVGWAVGPPHLTRAVSSVQQWVTFSAPTPNQDAIAICLKEAKEPFEAFDSYYEYLASEYRRKRNLLCDALRSAGIDPIVPDGGFFVMGDTSTISFPNHYLEDVTEAMPASPMPNDWAMSRWMTQEVGVTAIPPSAFYCKENLHLAKDLLRFAYCKSDETILAAQERFHDYFK